MTGPDLPVPSETERAAARQQSELSLLRSYTGFLAAENGRLWGERHQLSSMLRAMARKVTAWRRYEVERDERVDRHETLMHNLMVHLDAFGGDNSLPVDDAARALFVRMDDAEDERDRLRAEVVELRRAAADELSRLGQEGDLGGPRRVDDLDVAEAMLTNLRDADQPPGGRPAGGAREAGHIRSPWESCTCVIFGTAYDVGELDPVCPRHGAGRSPAMDVDRE